MGTKEVPSKSAFAAFLRRTITDSVEAGYSVMPLSQFKITDATIKWFGSERKWYSNGWNRRLAFFPRRKVRTFGRRSNNRAKKAGNRWQRPGNSSRLAFYFQVMYSFHGNENCS